jgi:glycosyltransferase domain-containing protein
MYINRTHDSYDLTVLLPLWDRDIYTRNWLEANYSKRYHYLIADGSSSPNNQAIVNTYSTKKCNIDYYRHPYDNSVSMYIEKMYKSVNVITTPFVMTADNDDFLNFAGIDKCIDLLNLDPSAAFVSAPIRFIYRRHCNQNPISDSFHLLSYRQSFTDLDCMTGQEAISALMHFYRPVYYSVYRTETYKLIWSTIYNLGLTNLYLIEILQALLSFALGKFRSVNTTHYIRLLNSVSSSASIDINENHRNPHSAVIFDSDYRRQLKSVVSHLSSNYHMPTDFLQTCFCEYYFQVPPVSETNLTPLRQILLRIPKCSSFVPWSINSIRGYANMFGL